MFAGVLDLLQGDQELGCVLQHPAAMEKAVNEIGNL
jgi:hypothetical protein